MRNVVRSLATLGLFCIASSINPGYFSGCASDEHTKLEFGEREMLELVDEANATGPFELERAGHRYRVELLLTQKPGEDVDDVAAHSAFTQRAYACGSRTFLQSAAACFTTSIVPLRAELSVFELAAGGDAELIHERELEGQLWVGGEKLTNGRIELRDASGSTSIVLSSPHGSTIQLESVRALGDDGLPML